MSLVNLVRRGLDRAHEAVAERHWWVLAAAAAAHAGVSWLALSLDGRAKITKGRRSRTAMIKEAAKRLHEKDATLLAWQAAGADQPSFYVRSRADLLAGARLFDVAQHRLADPVGA